MIQITPHGNRVLAEFEEFKLAGGLILPGNDGKPADQKLGKWVIRKVGEGRLLDNGTLIPVPFKIGDAIMFDPRAKVVKFGNDAIFGKRTQIVVPVEDILGTADGEPDLTHKEIVRAGRMPTPKPELVH